MGGVADAVASVRLRLCSLARPNAATPLIRFVVASETPSPAFVRICMHPLLTATFLPSVAGIRHNTYRSCSTPPQTGLLKSKSNHT